ncbi:MAG TPA: hypothetical protein PK637_04635 [Flavobacteriales bacterium]|nr:hypothetical protein [Flavobacteriales bacterium]
MGKVNIWEILIIAVAIMWLMGVFRRAASNRTEEKVPDNKKVHGQTKPVKEQRYGDDDSEFTDYEELR